MLDMQINLWATSKAPGAKCSLRANRFGLVSVKILLEIMKIS